MVPGESVGTARGPSCRWSLWSRTWAGPRSQHSIAARKGSGGPNREPRDHGNAYCCNPTGCAQDRPSSGTCRISPVLRLSASRRTQQRLGGRCHLRCLDLSTSQLLDDRLRRTGLLPHRSCPFPPAQIQPTLRLNLGMFQAQRPMSWTGPRCICELCRRRWVGKTRRRHSRWSALSLGFTPWVVCAAPRADGRMRRGRPASGRGWRQGPGWETGSILPGR